MSDEETALQRVIAETPTDRTAQLVYADWLEERGRGPESEAWRWIATFKRAPARFAVIPMPGATRPAQFELSCEYWNRHGLLGGYGWREDFFSWEGWPSSRYVKPFELPIAVARAMPGSDTKYRSVSGTWDGGPCDEYTYTTLWGAFGALVKGYVYATAPRTNRLSRFVYGPQWEPNWGLRDVIEGE